MENSQVEILLVEDNVDDAEMTIHAIRKKNLTNKLMHMVDGEQALDYLFGTGKFTGRDLNLKPRLILLDLKMPKVN
ncbi:MAG: response regulator, partial [Dyadobacter sp.]